MPLNTANCDQLFLREVIWPIARQSCCIHDSFFDVLGARPFPSSAKLPAGQHVGQNQNIATLRNRPSGALSGAPAPGEVIESRRRFVFTIATGRCGTAFLTELLRGHIKDAKACHERTDYRSFGLHTPDASHFMLFNSVGNVQSVRDFWRRKLT